MIIGISAKIHHGKDTVGKIIQDCTEKYEIKKFAYKLKQIVSILTGVSVEDLEKEEVKNTALPYYWQDPIANWCTTLVPNNEKTYRWLLQKVGTEAMRDNVHTNVWTNALFSEWHKGLDWVITDVRFPNEAYEIKMRGGKIIRVERPSIESKSSHPSETALDDYKYFDEVIVNDGTLLDLENKVLKFVNKFKLV